MRTKTVTIVHERIYPTTTTIYRNPGDSWFLRAWPAPKQARYYTAGIWERDWSEWRDWWNWDIYPAISFRAQIFLLHFICFVLLLILVDATFRQFGSFSLALFSVVLGLVARARGESPETSVAILMISSVTFLTLLLFLRAKERNFSENGMRWAVRIVASLVVYAVISG